MTLDKEVSNLDERTLRSRQDPTESLTQRDALVLYLAHLNRLADLALQRVGVVEDVRRRYTHPAWNDDTAEANSSAMKRLMAESIALARHCALDFQNSMLMVTARQVLQHVRTLDDSDLPYNLILDSVREATAAGAGALMESQVGRRRPYVILDIGAGTTDVAGCLCVNSANKDSVIVAEVITAGKAIRRGGNNIDDILLAELLRRSSCEFGSIEYDRVSRGLRRDIRGYKERLFNNGSIVVVLNTDERIEIELTEFLAIEPMVRLFNDIAKIVVDAAFAVVGGDGPVRLVATGGGANLPIVETLLEQTIQKDGKRMKLEKQAAMPQDLQQIYPTLIDNYAQLAVAIGGSHPHLPTQIPSVAEGIRVPGPISLMPVYR